MEVDNKKNDQNIIPNDADKPQKGVNVPNLRFKEYYENWTIKPLGAVCKFLKGRGISKEDLSNTGNPCILYGELYTTYKTAIIKDIKSKTLLELKSLVRSKSNDVLIPCSGETAEDIATSICVPYDDVLIGGDLTIIRSELNGAFLSNQINSVRKLNIAKVAQGKSIVHLQADELKKINISFPRIAEQQKIANFIDLLDQRIDTQSKIIEDLQTLKISICDKVFEDTTYPEYKLKDVLSERIEKSNVNNQYEILSSTIKGLFTQKEYFDKDIASSNNIGYKIVHLYDIIISPQNLWMGNITFNQRFTNGLVSPSYKIYIINNNFDMYYIANMLKTKRAMYKYICSSQQGASVVRRNLNMDDFLSLSFNIPDINKQRKIRLLLNTIDKRIDLEQTYLTKLNQQKKFLLKNMFI